MTLDLANRAANLTALGFVLRRLRVKIGSGDAGSQKSDTSMVLQDLHTDVYSLAVLTDAYSFSIAAFGVAPKTPVVAQMRSLKWRSFVTAESYLQGPVLDYYTAGLAGLVDLGIDYDIAIGRDARASRVTLYHEYGHWVLAEIFAQKSRENLTHFWGLNFQSAFLKDRAPTRGAHVARMVNEGFADFFSIMATGGASYGQALAERSGPRVEPCVKAERENYHRCFERNIGSAIEPYWLAPNVKTALAWPYQDRPWSFLLGTDSESIVRRGATIVSTFLVDVVDGNENLALGAGFIWRESGRGITVRQDDVIQARHANDERVALSGESVVRALQRWIQRFSPAQAMYADYDSLLHDDFAAAFAEVALNEHADIHVCELFSLHSPSRSCPQLGQNVQNQWSNVEPLSDLKVHSTTAFNDKNPALLVLWKRLENAVDLVELEVQDVGGNVREKISRSGSVPLASFGRNLEFDETYVVHGYVRRHERYSSPRFATVVTPAERPTSLSAEPISDYGLRLRWNGKASRYVVVLEGEESGRRVEYDTVDNSYELGERHFPEIALSTQRTMNSEFSSPTGTRERRAIVRVYGVNRVGERSALSRMALTVDRPSNSWPSMRFAPANAIAFAEECELGIDDISVEMLTLETGDAGGEGDVTAVSVSDGRTFSVVGEMTSGLCHHTELIDDGDFGFLGYAQCSGDAPLIFAFHWRAGERALTVNHAMCPTPEYF